MYFKEININNKGKSRKEFLDFPRLCTTVILLTRLQGDLHRRDITSQNVLMSIVRTCNKLHCM